MPTSKQRREAERRRLQRQAARRAQRQAARRRLNVILSIVGTLIVIAVVITFIVATGDDDKKTAAGGSSSTTPSPSTSTSPSDTTSPSTSTSAAPVAAYPCTWTKSGTATKPAKVPASTKPPKKGIVTVDLTTSQGAVTFSLDRSKAPCAVASFVSLAEQGYFNATPCHRLTAGTLSVLQCGDPGGTGTGGPGYTFADELTGKEKYTRGVLAMANSGANTNGSQFFIVYKNSTLGPNYTIFGTVSKGLGVIDKVAAKGSTPANDGKPNLPINLTKVLVLA